MYLPRGLTARLTATTILPLSVVGVLFAIYFAMTRIDGLQRTFKEDGQNRALQLARTVELAQQRPDGAQLSTALRVALESKFVLRVAYVNASGETLTEQRKSTFSLAEPKSILAFNAPVFEVRENLDDPLRPKAIGRVELALDAQPLNEATQQVSLVTALFSLCALAILAAFALWQARRFAKPLADVSDAVRRLAAGDLRARIEPAGVAEVHALGLGVNNLARAIGESQRTLSEKVEQATAALKAQRDEASAASQAKSRFLAAASHDLRQPMHALGLFCSALVRKVQEPDQKHLIGNIQLSLQAMEGLFESLLDLSRLEAGRVQANMTLTSLAEVLQWLANEFGPAARDKGLRFRVRPSQEWGYVDPTLLRRILLNLTSNAIRYTAEGGILVGVRRCGEVVRLEVWDTGRGIDSADMDAIFDEFVQVDTAANDKTKGLGLGLAIAQKSARLMGTRIQVASKKGRGSVFSVELLSGRPTRAALITREDPEATAVIALRVLVIEDDEAGRQAMTVLLEHWSCEVRSIESATQLDMVLANHWLPQLIISDYRLRGKETGPAVIEQVELRRKSDYSIPVVIVSGELGLEEVFSATWPRHWELLKKPVSAQSLRAAMNKVLSRG